MDISTEKTKILEAGLTHVPFDGWTLDVFEKAAESQNMDKAMVMAVFPRGIADILDYFAVWADNKMLDALKDVKTDDLKIRACIRTAMEKRIEILTPHKEAVSLAFKKMMHPQYARMGGKITWRTADVIWTWAGDNSTDYNRYTKRGLLSGVIGTTMTYWLRQDDDFDNAKTFAFLNNRIENVVKVGQTTSKIIKPLEGFYNTVVKPNIKNKMGKI
jgi:ubiquinone biosynthesis protein COQ9